jgi:hypothetical protein
MNSHRLSSLAWLTLTQLASFVCFFITGPAAGQLIGNAQIISATATSGTVYTNGYVYMNNQLPGLTVNSFPTGFNFSGNLFWENVLTSNATLTMVVRGTLDPNYAPQPMILGASMGGFPLDTFDVPASHSLNPPHFALNSFSLQTMISGNPPYPNTIATVTGPFNGGTNGLFNQPYAAANQTNPFNYAYNAAYPFLDLILTMNADGLSVPGVFRIHFPASASFTPVPEPTSLTFVAALLGTLAATHTRGRRSKSSRRSLRLLVNRRRGNCSLLTSCI